MNSIYRLSQLKQLEAESIHIFRDAISQFENPVLLYSIGKDSSVLVHLAKKAFYPGRLPFKLLHIDSTFKFREMIEFRDRFVQENDLDLIVHSNQEGIAAGVNPFTYGSRKYTDIMKTQALIQALTAGKYDAVFGGARRDEEKSRAKERIFSFRDKFNQWDPKNQRPELWNIYNGRINPGESVRIFPLSNWPASVAKSPTTRALLLRDGSQEPIDDLEYDYLVHLAHDFELIYEGESQKREERHIAQTLQIGMRNSLGDVPGIATDSVYLSATNSALVGGDFYTLIRLPDDCAVMILGDVSGKGIEAASMSALVKTALTAYAWEGAGPARMARSLNSMLMGFSRVETFVTAFIAKIDLKAGRATYCSAGHPPTMVIRPESMPLGGGEARGGEVELLGCQSGVIGAFESMVYETGVFTFAPGDMLFMYTDGTIEARDRTGAFFGEQRLRDLLLSVSGEGVSGICGKVLGELDRFTESALDDDIALVSLEFLRGRS